MVILHLGQYFGPGSVSKRQLDLIYVGIYRKDNTDHIPGHWTSSYYKRPSSMPLANLLYCAQKSSLLLL